jgi:2-oxoglutarate ferredoxin oxidoreductase subunit delta
MEETATEKAPADAAEAPAGAAGAAEAEAPAATGEARRHRAPGRRYIYKRWCKGCGICVAFCPEHVFALGEDGRATPANPEACTNCQICDRLCPDFAITLTDWEDKYERMFQPTSLGQDKAEGSRGAVD